MRRPGILLLSLAAASVWTSLAPAQESADGPGYRLAYRFTPDQVVEYDVTHSMTITSRKGELEETAQNESRTRRHYRVVGIEGNGIAVLESYIDRVYMTAKFGGNDPIVYDSTSSEKPPHQFSGVSDKIGKPLAQVRVRNNGSLEKIIPLQRDTEGNRDVPETDDASQNFLVVFPDRPLQVGETWKEPFTVKVNVTEKLRRDVDLSRTCRLDSVEGNLATISVKTSVLSPVQDSSIRAQLIQRAPEGTIVFDVERGLIVSRDMTIDGTEVGAFGPGSSMQAVSRLTERLVDGSKVREASATKP